MPTFMTIQIMLIFTARNDWQGKKIKKKIRGNKRTQKEKWQQAYAVHTFAHTIFYMKKKEQTLNTMKTKTR